MRTYLNNSAITGQIADCDPKCKVQTMENSKYNLASKDHNDLWKETIFELSVVADGHCHTYNPVNNSFARNRGQFYAMLGNVWLKAHAQKSYYYWNSKSIRYSPRNLFRESQPKL